MLFVIFSVINIFIFNEAQGQILDVESLDLNVQSVACSAFSNSGGIFFKKLRYCYHNKKSFV